MQLDELVHPNRHKTHCTLPLLYRLTDAWSPAIHARFSSNAALRNLETIAGFRENGSEAQDQRHDDRRRSRRRKNAEFGKRAVKALPERVCCCCFWSIPESAQLINGRYELNHEPVRKHQKNRSTVEPEPYHPAGMVGDCPVSDGREAAGADDSGIEQRECSACISFRGELWNRAIQD